MSPGPKEACPGSVRPPLLYTLLQAAHQVDWRSSDHLQPCEMQNPSQPNACTLTDMLQHILCYLLFLLTSGSFSPPMLSYFIQTHPSHDWTLILKSVNHTELTMLILSKGVHFLFQLCVLSLINWLLFVMTALSVSLHIQTIKFFVGVSLKYIKCSVSQNNW